MRSLPLFIRVAALLKGSHVCWLVIVFLVKRLHTLVTACCAAVGLRMLGSNFANVIQEVHHLCFHCTFATVYLHFFRTLVEVAISSPSQN